MKPTRVPRRPPRGQGMTENIITVALVAIATVGIISLYGDNMRNLFGIGSDALGGNERDNNGRHATGALTDKNLSNFGQNNSGGAGSGGNPGTNGGNQQSGGTQGGSGNGGNPGTNSATGG